MAATPEQIAEHEALFRAANDRVNAGAESARPTAALSFYCECANLDCQTQLQLSKAEYEAVRADPMRFMVVRGHESPEVERVIEEHEGYFVVEKHEDVRAIVERADPRAGA